MKKIITLVCVALVAGTAAATAPAIPKGFLLYEKAAAKKDNDPRPTGRSATDQRPGWR